MRLRICSPRSDQLPLIRNPSYKSPTTVFYRAQCRLSAFQQASIRPQRRLLSTTQCSREEADQDDPDESNERDPEEFVLRLMKRSLRQGREEGWGQNFKHIQEQSKYKVYSLPEPMLYRGSTPDEIRQSRRGQSLEDLQLSNFYASQATPPLLLTFDAFDTLYTPKSPVPEQYCDVAAQFGYTVEKEAIEASFRKEFKEQLETYPQYGKTSGLSVETWWKGLIARIFTPFLPHAAVIDPNFLSALYVRFATSDGYKLYSDVPPLLQRIGASFSASSWAPRRTIIGVVSNSDPRLRSVLRTLKVALQPGLYPPRFAPVHPQDNPSFGPASVSFEALSYELDVDKPDPRIFDHALRLAQDALGQPAPVARMTRSGKQLLSSIREEFWHCHIGDSVEKDVLPALQAGWDAILLDREASTPVTSRFADTQEYTVINSLDVLASVLTPQRAKDTMVRGRQIRQQRRASNAEHALDFEDAVDPQGTLGFKASHFRTVESMKYLGGGGGPLADQYREDKRRARRAAIARSRSGSSE